MDKISMFCSYLEATKSDTAIRKGIENKPNPAQLQAMIYVASNVFDKVRVHCGTQLAITSFFRCEELNRAIGGSINSQHCKGEAIDIDADIFGKTTNKEVFYYILNNLEFDQLIWEFGNHLNPDWVHVSLKKSGNRKQVLKAIRQHNKTVYIPFEL